jgi:hypothetical protein
MTGSPLSFLPVFAAPWRGMWGRVVVAAPAALLAAALLGGCDEPPGGSPDAGNINLSDAGPFRPPPDAGFDDAGNPIGGDAGPVNSVVVVESVTPPSGPLQGGNRVILEGAGFTGACSLDPPPGAGTCRVLFGDVEGDLINAVQLPRKISVRVPPCAEPGPVTVRVITDLGIGELEGGYSCFSPLFLDGIEPDRGSTEGGEPITITGRGFTPSMIVTVGDRQVVDLDVDPSGTTATFFTPPGSIGRADVLVIDAFGRAIRELGFTYEAPLRLARVQPNIVADTGAIVELRGSGFSDKGAEQAAARVGGLAAATVNLISDARLRVQVPLGLSGPQDVAVRRGAEDALLEDALVVLPPPTGGFVLTAALPARADVDGGETITLVGEGLSSASSVTVAGVAGTDLTVVDDRTLTFVSPAAAATGPATIQVTRADASTAQLPGFSYFQPVILDRVIPASGPVAGGEPVTLTGRGFGDAPGDPIDVRFGGMPATDVVIVSETELRVRTPPGAAGLVDVVVRVGDERAVLTDGFRFDAELTVLGVRPSRGASGGDTFVTITGTGFTRGNVAVSFGGTPALFDVRVVNDSTITVRTPPHEPGLVDVTVSRGLEQAAARVFTYFNAAGNIVGGTRGGVIEGAVYITALDAQLGLPIPGLIAYVGTDGSPVESGITNVFGQATISGPDIYGPQTVTVLGDCFSSATFVDVNATELTVFLFPLCAPPPQPGPPPPPPPPATIRGRVFGFAKEIFDPAVLDQSGCRDGPPAKCEIAFAEVNTTSRDEFSGTAPAGGNNIVFEEGGEYFIARSRTGRLAVVALAGIYDLNNDTFRLRQLGVRREVFPQRGVNLLDQDIELTIILDEELDLSLPDAPLRFDESQVGFRPTVTRVVPALQFGGEGAYVYTQAVEGKRNHRLKEMPDLPLDMMTFIAGAFTTDGRNLITQTGTVNIVAGERAITGLGTNTAWSQTGLNGAPLVLGNIFVTDRPNGSRFASVIIGVPNGTTLQLMDAPDFSASARQYHIGSPGSPSSEVIQDGLGNMRGGITIQPVLGLPEPLSPLEGGVMVDRTLRWKAPPGQQPSIHDMFLYDPFEFASVWQVYADGARTKVIVPRVPTREDIVASLPTSQRLCLEDPEASNFCRFWGDLEAFVPPSDMKLGGVVWQHESVFTPGLDFSNWSLLELGLRGRRAWTTDVHVFVKGLD